MPFRPDDQFLNLLPGFTVARHILQGDRGFGRHGIRDVVATSRGGIKLINSLCRQGLSFDFDHLAVSRGQDDVPFLTHVRGQVRQVGPRP